MFKTYGAFKKGYAVQIVRIIPRKYTSRIYGKPVTITGILRFFQNRIRKLPFRKSNKKARLSQSPFNSLLRFNQFMSHTVSVKTVKRSMTERMTAELHAVIRHFFYLFPCQVSGTADKIRNKEYGTPHFILLQNRVGILVIIRIPVIKGD